MLNIEYQECQVIKKSKVRAVDSLTNITRFTTKNDGFRETKNTFKNSYVACCNYQFLFPLSTDHQVKCSVKFESSPFFWIDQIYCVLCQILDRELNKFCLRNAGGGGTGGGGHSRKFFTGRLRPKVQILTLLNTFLTGKVNTLQREWYPFHIPTVETLTLFQNKTESLPLTMHNQTRFR